MKNLAKTDTKVKSTPKHWNTLGQAHTRRRWAEHHNKSQPCKHTTTWSPPPPSEPTVQCRRKEEVNIVMGGADSDSPAEVKRQVPTKTYIGYTRWHVNDQLWRQPHRPHDSEINAVEAAKLSGSPPRHPPLRSTHSINTAFQDRHPDASPLSSNCNTLCPSCLQSTVHRPRPSHHIHGRWPHIPSNRPR